MRSRILIAHRTEIFPRDFVAELVQRHIEVIEASSAAEVFRCLQDRIPDLLVMYASTENAQATLVLAREVRDKYSSRLLLVFVAVDSSEELAIAVFRAGFNGYLRLPGSPAEIADALEGVISRKITRDRPLRASGVA